MPWPRRRGCGSRRSSCPSSPGRASRPPGPPSSGSGPTSSWRWVRRADRCTSGSRTARSTSTTSRVPDNAGQVLRRDADRPRRPGRPPRRCRDRARPRRGPPGAVRGPALALGGPVRLQPPVLPAPAPPADLGPGRGHAVRPRPAPARAGARRPVDAVAGAGGSGRLRGGGDRGRVWAGRRKRLPPPLERLAPPGKYNSRTSGFISTSIPLMPPTAPNTMTSRDGTISRPPQHGWPRIGTGPLQTPRKLNTTGTLSRISAAVKSRADRDPGDGPGVTALEAEGTRPDQDDRVGHDGDAQEGDELFHPAARSLPRRLAAQ